MAVLKIRGEDGVVREIFALKGEKGDKGDPGSGGGGGDASQITYNSEGQYIQASTVEEALHAASDHIIGLHMAVDGKANEFHEHAPSEVRYANSQYGTSNVEEALNYLFSQVGDVSSAFDELHAYAQALVNGGGTE